MGGYIRTALMVGVVTLVGLAAGMLYGGDAKPSMALFVSGNEQVQGVAELLETALANNHDIVLLDRTHIEKILQEHHLSIAGVVREPIRQGNLLGASYILNLSDAEGVGMPAYGLLLLEVASGNVIFERVITHHHEDALLDTESSEAPAVAEMLAGIAKNEASQSNPSAVVAAVLNKSASERLNYLEDTVRGILEALLEQQGYRLLRRHHPGLLAGEIALSSLGLARPDATVLAVTGDMALSVRFSESPLPDQPFEKTPIHLDLEITIRGTEATQHRILFTPGSVDELHRQLLKIIPGNPARSDSAVQDDNLQRLIEAARLMSSLEDESRDLFVHDPATKRKQVELAQRVIYLDPTAKEAYFFIARAIHSSITQTTGLQNSNPQGSWKEVADAYQNYLYFPRTNSPRVRSAFMYALDSLQHVCKGDELIDRSVTLLRDYYCWMHSLNPNVLPVGRPFMLSEALNVFWSAHPEKWVEFYTWLDRLYSGKKGLAVFPFESARAWDQAGNRMKAAEYLYDATITHRPDEIQLNSYLQGPDDYQWARDLASLLPTDRAARVIARLDHRLAEKSEHLIPWGGLQPGGMNSNNGGAYGYSSIACSLAMERLMMDTVKPESVSLPEPLRYCFICRRTPSGLWVLGASTTNTVPLMDRYGRVFGLNYPRVIYRSVNGERWQRIEDVTGLTGISSIDPDVDGNWNHNLMAIAQAGADVVFAMNYSGLYVYNLTNGWSHIGMKEGLPDKRIDTLAVGLDDKSVWVAGAHFLCQYKDAGIFFSSIRLKDFSRSLSVSGNQIYTLGYDPDNLFSLDVTTKTTSVLFDGKHQRRECRVPEYFYVSARRISVMNTSFCRILTLHDRVFFVSPYGLHVLTPDGQPLRFWWGGAFAHWEELGVWIEGNCPIPPRSLIEIIQDDQDPYRLWLLSIDGYGNSRNTSDFERMRPDSMVGRVFLTAYDWQKDLFSKPVHIDQLNVGTVEAHGDYLYFAGSDLSRAKKNLWVLDQPGEPIDAPLRVSCPDKELAPASIALFYGDFDAVRKHLTQNRDPRLSDRTIKRMLSSLDQLSVSGK